MKLETNDLPTKPTSAKVADLPTLDPQLEKPVQAVAGQDYYVSGGDERAGDERVVAISVAVQVDIKVGEREFSAPICLHEIVAFRKFYEGKANGTLRLVPHWTPLLSRLRKLNQAELQAEAKRLASTLVIPRQSGPPLQCFHAFYGADENTQLKRLHEVMREQLEAWNALLAKTRAKIPGFENKVRALQDIAMWELITERDLDAIANLADPARNGLDVIQLAEVSEAPAVRSAPVSSSPSLAEIEAQVEAEDKPDAIDIRLKKLRTAGLTERQANELASLLEVAGSGATLAREDLAKIVGNKLADSPAVQAAIKG